MPDIVKIQPYLSGGFCSANPTPLNIVASTDSRAHGCYEGVGVPL